MLILYSLTLFLSAVLLFTVEPMVGKMLLPRCGGTPAVWNTCMVFYQAVLLLGYGYAHLSTLYLGVRRQAIFHLFVILLPLLVLPLFFDPNINPPSDANPGFWLLTRLAVVVGLPFFVLSTTAPLLQKWFAHTGHPSARDPYFLYSTSNAGSLIALLAYPFLIEPSIGLQSQSQLWRYGYIGLIAAIFCSAIALWRSAKYDRPAVAESDGAEPESESDPAIAWKQRLKWIFLAFVPSSLMLGATMHITTDIASAPLLWVIPLAIYLLTFILVFARKQIFTRSWLALTMAIAAIAMPLVNLNSFGKFWLVAGFHLLTFFVIAMVCHGELARTRPKASKLTEFYFLMSLGGVLGGLFNSMLAPVLFDSTRLFNSVVEYPLMIVAACFAMPGVVGSPKRKAFDAIDLAWLVGMAIAIGASEQLSSFLSHRLAESKFTSAIVVGALYGLPAAMCFFFKGRPIRFALGIAMLFLLMDYRAYTLSGKTLLLERNFFGVKSVCVRDFEKQPKFHVLYNGRTIHGMQTMYPEPSREMTGYYCRSGPLGDIFEAVSGENRKLRIGVIGLGCGVMAGYDRSNRHFTYYEIDPAVVAIATDPKLFTFLDDCRDRCEIKLGDARLELAKAADGEFDLLVLDAFSSDSIPIHLLTQEALELYLGKLKAGGVLAMHVSNRNLDLTPVLGQLAAANHLTARTRIDMESDLKIGKCSSKYVVMARHESELGDLAKSPRWTELKIKENVRLWTDDYSDIISCMLIW